MRALVTGGAGFIGSNLVDALLARGDEVTVVDNLATGRIENLDGAPPRAPRSTRPTSATPRRVAQGLRGARPEIVFHLAAQIDVRKSIADPAWTPTINVGGTINVLEAARRPGVARVVNTSHRRRDLRRRRRRSRRPRPRRRARWPPTARQALRRDVLRAVRAPVRPLGGDAALRQRLRPASGPARRGRRHRDLLRQADRRRRARPSSATAARRATTPTWPTSSPRTSPPPRIRGRRRLQRRHRERVLGARGPRRAAARGRPRGRRASSRSSRRPALGELQRSAPRRQPGAGRARLRARRPTSTTGCGARSSGRARRRRPASRMAGPAPGTDEFLRGGLRADRRRRAPRPLAGASAEAKADHVIDLAHAIGCAPASVRDRLRRRIVLALLGPARVRRRRVGFEIAAAASRSPRRGRRWRASSRSTATASGARQRLRPRLRHARPGARAGPRRCLRN